MNKFIFILLFSSILLAKTPIVYATLGDIIYNNSSNIVKLKEIKEYKNQVDFINKYLSDVAATKEKGFAIENGDKEYDKREYLNKLRLLAKIYDAFVREANRSFHNSIDQEDSILFSKIINSGLIDTKKNKEKIITYYFSHIKDINSTGVIQNYLEKDKALKAKREAQKKRYKTKKMIETEKIKRIRETDKLEHERLEKKLSDEVKQKKLEIRETQKKELFN